MLTVTEPARAHFAQMLVEAQAPGNAAVRFVRTKQGIGLELDVARPSDTPFAHEGRTVLVLDEVVTELLADKTLDVESAGEGSKLALT